MTKLFRMIDGGAPEGAPLNYKACGLDDVYLVNGFKREFIDGEECISVENLDGLWKAIGMHLVTKKKVLAPKEIRFLREHMDFTQAELGARLRVSDQTVARWEKGQTESFDGPADLSLRVLFLASKIAQPEGGEMLAKLNEIIDEVVQSDTCDVPARTVFRHGRRNWKEEPRELACA
jgi:DNA-binding transcriptional regulator YiaG